MGEIEQFLGEKIALITTIGVIITAIALIYSVFRKSKTVEVRETPSRFDQDILDRYGRLVEEKAEWTGEREKLKGMIRRFLASIEKSGYAEDQWEELFIKLVDDYVKTPDVDTFDIDAHLKALIRKARQTFEQEDLNTADQMLEAAETENLKNTALLRAERARLHYQSAQLVEAADHYQQAARLLPVEEPTLKIIFLGEAADALYDHGDLKGDNAALERSIALWQEALSLSDRTQTPDRWAGLQVSLGTALQKLGERNSDSQRLEEAVTAYHEALLVYTRDTAPLKWAGTQNNLGNALQALGERDQDPQRLEEAVTAYHKALKEWTRDTVPLKWAMTQNNLGNALATLGQRDQDPQRLEEAVTAFHEALKERTRDTVPLDWAMTQNNLGNALATLGKRDQDPQRLEEAVTAYHEALKEWTRDTVPLKWATTQNNLGMALGDLGRLQEDSQTLLDGIEAYEASLLERTFTQVPLDWTHTQFNIAFTWLELYQVEPKQLYLDRAEEKARLAHESYKTFGYEFYIEKSRALLEAIQVAKDAA